MKLNKYNMKCYYCEQIMNVSEGQLVYYHKQCRGKAREKYSSMTSLLKRLKQSTKL